MTTVVARALLISLVVGFVTSSIRSYIDRIFLVLLAVFLLHMPIKEAILVNLIVMALASSFFYARHEGKLAALPRGFAWWTALSAAMGAALGRGLGLALSSQALAVVLGVYAVAVGVRLLLVKIPSQGSATPGPAAYPLAFAWAILTGLISAGGKPFQVPVLTKGLRLPPNVAYLIASLGTLSAALAAILTQVTVAPEALGGHLFTWATYFFASITTVALVVERYWTPRLQQAVSYVIAPLLVLAGLRLMSL